MLIYSLFADSWFFIMITGEFYFGTATDCLHFIRTHCDSFPIGNKSGSIHKPSILSIRNHFVPLCHVLYRPHSYSDFHYSLSQQALQPAHAECCPCPYIECL